MVVDNEKSSLNKSVILPSPATKVSDYVQNPNEDVEMEEVEEDELQIRESGETIDDGLKLLCAEQDEESRDQYKQSCVSR